MAQWEASLPQRPQRRGYSRTPLPQTIGAPVERGAHKARRKFTFKAEKITAPYKMNQTQRETFEDTFFDVTLGGGVFPFDLPDPEDEAEPPGLISVAFPPGETPYKVIPRRGKSRWLVTLNLVTQP